MAGKRFGMVGRSSLLPLVATAATAPTLADATDDTDDATVPAVADALDTTAVAAAETFEAALPATALAANETLEAAQLAAIATDIERRATTPLRPTGWLRTVVCARARARAAVRVPEDILTVVAKPLKMQSNVGLGITFARRST